MKKYSDLLDKTIHLNGFSDNDLISVHFVDHNVFSNGWRTLRAKQHISISHSDYSNFMHHIATTATPFIHIAYNEVKRFKDNISSV